mmetsp:Transcript_977/g.2491  ORF Transcript_977/g.2491 Transcript_977/m.2491 type:complete len:213 (-) Transcript_977:2-640(-)
MSSRRWRCSGRIWATRDTPRGPSDAMAPNTGPAPARAASAAATITVSCRRKASAGSAATTSRTSPPDSSEATDLLSAASAPTEMSEGSAALPRALALEPTDSRSSESHSEAVETSPQPAFAKPSAPPARRAEDGTELHRRAARCGADRCKKVFFTVISRGSSHAAHTAAEQCAAAPSGAAKDAPTKAMDCKLPVWNIEEAEDVCRGLGSFPA